MKLRPIVFGEVLEDRFPDGSRRWGGAPLNVAAHLAALGADPLLISRVGSDAEGDRARSELGRLGLDRAGLQVDPDRPTGAVEVELEGGEPRFTILPDRAWDRIEAAAAVAALPPDGSPLFVHGTLAARSEPSRSALVAVRAGLDAPRFVDVNLRPPWTPIERALELARGAAWLKANREELGALAGESVGSGAAMSGAARRLVRSLGLGALVVTDGERGAHLWRADGEEAHAASPRVPPRLFADAVGAGDALAAVLVLGTLAGWPAALALERGTELAAAVCTLRGALPVERSFYRPFLEAWDVAAPVGAGAPA